MTSKGCGVKFNALAKTAEKFVIDNSPAILSGLAVAGVVSTVYLAVKATFKASDWIEGENQDRRIKRDKNPLPMSPKEKFALTWRLYIPAVGTGALTIASIIGSNRIGAARATALAAAFKISESAFDEYKTKVIEKIGEKKESVVRDEIAQNRVNQIPAGKEVIFVGGTQLCFDMFSGRSFMADLETLRQAQNTLNHRILSDFYASLSDYYDLIGLPPIGMSDEVGWNSDKLLECTYSGVLHEGKPMIAIDFSVVPIRGYNRLV